MDLFCSSLGLHYIRYSKMGYKANKGILNHLLAANDLLWVTVLVKILLAPCF